MIFEQKVKTQQQQNKKSQSQDLSPGLHASSLERFLSATESTEGFDWSNAF